MPLHPDAIVIMDWTPDAADITPEMARRFCETGDLTALDDIVRLGLKSLNTSHVTTEPEGANDAANTPSNAA